MLIELDRSEVPGVIAQGVAHEWHWRAIRDIGTGYTDESREVNCVYIQVFVPVQKLGLPYGTCTLSMPARYARDGDCVIDCSVITINPDDAELLHQQRLLWVETYYGKLWTSVRGNPVAAEMFYAWYPRKRLSRYVDVLPRTFMKYVQTSAQYMCNYLDLVMEERACAERSRHAE